MGMYRQFLPYGVAIGATTTALLLKFWLAPVLPNSADTFFEIAVIVSTWYGGFWPGMVATGFSALAIQYFLILPIHSWGIEPPTDSLRLATFLFVAFTINWLGSNPRDRYRPIEPLNPQLAPDSADQLPITFKAQAGEQLLQQQFEQQRLVMEMTQRIRQSLKLQEILQTTVDEVRQFLQVDRVIIFQFEPTWGGTVTVESVGDEAFAILPFKIYDPCIGNIYVEPFQQGLVTAKADIYNANISPCHIEFLAQFQIRANLVVPILKNGELWGLLAAHHCTAPRQWQNSEIDLLKQIASQVSIALQQSVLLEHLQIELTERKQAEFALQELNTELEQRVAERTAELTALNDRLLVALKEQAQTQEALRDSEERRRLALDLTHIGFWDFHLLSGAVIWNHNHFTLLGRTPGECEPSYELWRSHVHPDDLDWVERRFFDSIANRTNYEAEYRVVYPDGSIHWLMARSQGIYDTDGQPLRSLGVLLDISDRKQTEQILALQAVITRNMAEGICLVRVDNGNIVYANPKFEQMFGYDAGELNGQPVSIVNYTSDSVTAEEVNQSIQAAVLQPGEVTCEVHNVKKDGTPFWCSATCSMFKHPEYGDVLVAVHQDITERKQTEIVLQQQTRQKQLLWNITQAIRQSLELKVILNTAVTEMRQLLEVDRVAVYRFNANWSGNFIVESVSDDWVKLVEPSVCTSWKDTYLQETQGGRFQNHETLTVTDIYTADLHACHIELLEQFQARAYAIAPLFVGEVLWGLFAIYQNRAPHGWEAWEIELLQQTTSQLAIAIQQSELYSQLQTELQERKQATAVLREAERRWRSLLDNVQLIVIGLDQSGHVNYVNPFFLSLAGYTHSEVMGKNWFENFLPPSNQASVQNVFSKVLASNAYPYYQNPILTKSGEERFIAWNNTLLQDSNGNIIGTISIGEDITERQKVEAMKNEFIGIVSHELRTPLTAIQMALGLLNTGIYAKKPDKFQRMIEIALIDTNRLVNLVNDILDLERLESGRVVLEKTLCQAADLMQQAVNGVQAIAMQQRITLTIAPTEARVWAAGDMIIQALTNLLSNAIKFSPAQSVIQLRAEHQADTVLFQVSDQGRGIPEDKLETIFGRFQQVDVSDSREKGGTGLGLPICQSIIERHGGKIWAESILGAGSTFFFTLPISSESNV